MTRMKLRRLHLLSRLALATLLPAAAHAAEKPLRHSRDLLALAGPCSAAAFAKAAEGLPVLCWERSAVQEVMTGRLLGRPLAIVEDEEDRKAQASKEEIAALLRSEGGQGEVKSACVVQLLAVLAAGGTVTFDRKTHPHCTISRLTPEALRAIFVEVRF